MKIFSVKKNVVIILLMCILIAALSAANTVLSADTDAENTVLNEEAPVYEEEAVAAGLSVGSGIGLLAAALVTGLSCIGGGIAVAASALSAVGAISENPKVFGQALIFVALAEGVALYGLLISMQILAKL